MKRSTWEKLLAFALALALMSVLAACQNSATTPSDNPNNNPSQPVSESIPGSEEPSTANPEPTAQVVVTGGTIQGYVDENGVATYKGIPYAAETSGENRFREPQPVVAWEDVKDCTKYGDITMQAEATNYGGVTPWTDEYLDLGKTVESGEMSEDSLNLNVWTMAAEGDKLPVIVYIHGGGNNSGSGICEIYTGEDIAQKGVVYVSINYRVGIFGFLAYKDSTGEEVTGNFGILDQIAALKWVQENIAVFGGDPANVTIVGQSAGSGNVQTLITSPVAAGLFNKAIAMSANAYAAGVFGPQTVEQAQEIAADSWVGQYTLAELRAMSAVEIQTMATDANGYNPSGTVIDGEVVTQSLAEAFASGNYNHVDMLWGSVTGDAGMFATLNLPDDDNNPFSPVTHATPAAYETAVREAYPEIADAILAQYAVDPNAEDVFDMAQEVMVDTMVTGYYYAASQKNGGDPNHKTYVYNFSHVVPDTPERMANFGAFHTGDVGYWLNHFTTTYPRDWSEIDYNLGEIMSSYLVNFAATGDPNGVDSQGNALPEWKDVASTAVISYLDLGDTVEFVEMGKDISDLWLSVQ